MPKQSHFQKLLHQIQVIIPPKHRLSTFGTTQIDYTLVTDMPEFPDRSKLRFGHLTTDKPLIITAETLKERFIGFDDIAREMADRMVSHYGEALRGIEYQFHHEPAASRIELAKPDEIVKDLAKDFDRDGDYRKALIRGTEQHWQLSLMKFIIEETLASFQSNVQELDERGFFDGQARIQNSQRREIKKLFQAARTDKQALARLGQKLKEYNLFDDYQDEFFKLLK